MKRQKERLTESVQEVLQLFAAGGVSQLPQSLGFDLADPFAGDVEFLAHFLQRAGTAILNAEAQLQNLSLTGRQG